MTERNDAVLFSGADDLRPELVPVVRAGTLVSVPLQLAEIAGDDLTLDGILSDALFGEVIDISDLIPRVLSSSVEAPPPGVAGAEVVAVDELDSSGGGDAVIAEGHPGLTILYDDDLLASGSTIL